MHKKIWLRSDPIDTKFVAEYLSRQDVREALHIHSDHTKFELCNDPIINNYRSQLEGSVWIYNIMKNDYKLLHFSGNTDGAVPTAGTKKWIRNQNYPITRAEREYKTDGFYTGHITEYGNFWFATVNGTGHMAPQWKRKQVTQLITNFVHGIPI